MLSGGGTLSPEDLQSQVIDWIRFPLIIAVIFIHSFGSAEVDFTALHENPLTSESVYNFVRIIFSKTAPHFAVPVFFMLSGFLFFYKTGELTADIYRKKMKRRAQTLLIPYILWNLLFVAKALLVAVTKSHSFSGIEEAMANLGSCLLWNHHSWADGIDWLGFTTWNSSPILTPFWYVRDLMVVVALAPAIYFLVKRTGLAVVGVLGLMWISRVGVSVTGVSAVSFFWFTLGAYFAIKGQNMVERLYKFRWVALTVCVVALPIIVWNFGQSDPLLSSVFRIYVTTAAILAVCVARFLIGREMVHVVPLLTKGTFFVFALHPFLLNLAGKIVAPLCSLGYAGSTVAYLVGPFVNAAICLAVYWFMCRFTPRTLSLLTGSRVTQKS